MFSQTLLTIFTEEIHKNKGTR